MPTSGHINRLKKYEVYQTVCTPAFVFSESHLLNYFWYDCRVKFKRGGGGGLAKKNRGGMVVPLTNLHEIQGWVDGFNNQKL
jgi:hypothetical protein